MSEIWRGIPVEIDRKEVLRYLGYRPGQQILTAEMAAAIDREIAGAAAMLAPAAVYATWAVAEATPAAVSLAGTDFVLRGTQVARHLARAEHVTVFAATVGGELEAAAAELFAAGEYSRAVILDAIGSDAAEQTAEAVNRRTNAAARAAGYGTVFRYSPGYGDWDLRAQSGLLRAVNAARLGLTVSAGGMLEPRKSVTAVIGWVRGCTRPRPGCAACELRDCQFRQDGEGKE